MPFQKHDNVTGLHVFAMMILLHSVDRPMFSIQACSQVIE